MRHSQPTASKNYLKVFDEKPNLIITNLKLEKDILEGDIKNNNNDNNLEGHISLFLQK